MSQHHQRMLQRYGLSYSTSLYSQVVFDPIFTPLFTAIFTSVGLTGTALSVATTAAAAIATTALAIGVQALLAPKPPKPESGKVPKTQSVPNRIWVVGRTRLAGAYVLWEASGKFLYAVQALAGHRIQSVNRYWLHDDEVEIDGSGYTTNDNNGRYGNNVRILSRLGVSPETAYAPLVSALSGSGTWTNNHRGDGQASVAMIAESSEAKNQQKRFPYGAPSLSVEVDGAKCWDFRDPAQNPDNPATWQWTRNSAVILCWHQCFNEFGERRDYHKAILPVIDMWKEEANICDENVPLAGGGTEKRYECNGWDTTENGPKVGTNSILATCDGWLCERGDGALLLTVGKFRESRVETLTDADIIGHQIQYDVLFEDECNRLVPKFTYPETAYSTCDTDYFEDTAAQLEAGRVLSQEADYGWCHQWRQARRLGKRDWLRLQQKVKGSIDVRSSGLNAVYSRWIRMSTPTRLPRLDGKLIENRTSTVAIMRGGYTMNINLHPDTIDDWNPAVDEGKQPPVPGALGSDEIVAPVINLVQAKPNGNAVYIRVVIIDPADDSLTPVVRYRVHNAGSGNPGAWVEQQFPDAVPATGYVDLNTNIVPQDTLLDIQAAFIGSNNSYGPWSITAQVTSTVDPVMPLILTSFTNTDAAPHLGRATIGFTTGNDTHIRTVQLFRVASGAPFDPGAIAPIATLAVSPNGTYSYVDGDATRTNLFTNPGFDTDTSWTKAGGWTISGGTANVTGGGGALLYQQPTIVNSVTYRFGYTVPTVTTASTGIQPFIAGSTPVYGAARTVTGSYRDKITNNASGNFAIGFAANGSFAGSLDNVAAFVETATCAPQGVWDYYASPFNGSGVIGPSIGPVTVSIV
ncbi:hypothetical protein [Rhizobium sp. P44RR-XXIV]|uniref:hypothetical protein n=1 Tax=Rhizobium sp. P44RR-XXIV TaxID=1921145 RepID=UPI0009852C92|nr:hypothetical protein [Rhizobium sp. P44RR-XXIV]TIX89183.1 hypothetical protein BSK43_021495 [Rhizobium sp. P44RR-XXIV]